MLIKPVRVAAIVFGLAILLAQSGSATRPAFASANDSPSGITMVRIPGHTVPALKRATMVRSGPASASAPMTLSLVLKRDDQTGFDRYLHQIYDPHSPNFHRFLTQPEIAARFGPSQKSYDGVVKYLRANGFQLIEGSPNHLTLTVRTQRAQVERTFALRINDYRIGQREFYANDRDPALPPQIASLVLGISGFSDLAQPRITDDSCKGDECYRKGCAENCAHYGSLVFNEYNNLGMPDEAQCASLISGGQCYLKLPERRRPGGHPYAFRGWLAVCGDRSGVPRRRCQRFTSETSG